MLDKIHLHYEGQGIAIITFNRPDALNALNLEMMDAFAHMVQSLHDDARLRVLILTGAGQKAFCSGGDLQQLRQRTTAEDAQQMIALMGDALLNLEQLPVPVMAAVNGYALGGGTEIALACDLRIVDENVKFGMVQVKMALTPGWGAGQRLLRLVGYARAMQILLQGKALNVNEVQALGLANQVTASGQALETALAWAQEIANHDVATVRGIKTLLQAGLTQGYSTALQTERELFPPLWVSEPHWVAVEQFLNRKNP